MDSSLNILIAEDEANIALALKTVVSKAVPGANITVSNNGREALDAISEKPYQLVISDWNMPLMTGIELLSELRKDESTIDIPFLMLTARGDKSSVITAVQGGVTQYISKPFERQDVIQRVQDLLGSQSVANGEEEKEEDTLSIESLSVKLRNGEIDFPVFPVVGLKAVELTKSDNVAIDELSKLIQQDASLTSKLLAIANSSYYSGNRKFDNIEDSLVRIGLRNTSNLILAISNRTLYKNVPGVIGERLNDLWEHSFATGACASVIARELGKKFPDRFFAMGLLHDIGKLALLTVLGALKKNHDASREAVDELMNVLHVEFGKSLASNWNMPAEFVDVVANHHNLEDMDTLPETTQVIAIANLLVRRMGKSLVPDDGTDLANTPLAQLLGLNNEMFDSIVEKTDEYINALRSSI